MNTKNAKPDRNQFVTDLRAMGYDVEQPESPLHLSGVKSECIIISREGSGYRLNLGLEFYDFYPVGAIDDLSLSANAVSKLPVMGGMREVVSFGVSVSIHYLIAQ
jgi:hypothetical protein